MKIFFILTTTFFIFLTPIPIYAQSDVLKNQGNVIFETVRYEQELQDLTVEYKNLLNTYVQAEADFKFAQAQYNQLQTLAAMEEAIEASKKVFIARDEVLIRYAKILKLKLYLTYGVYLPRKQAQIDQLDELIGQLEIHLQTTQAVTTRDELMQTTSDFELLGAQLQAQVQLTAPLFSLGKLQTTFDKTENLIAQIKQNVADSDLSAADKATKQRWLKLVNDKQAEAKVQLDAFNGPPQYEILRGEQVEVTPEGDTNSIYALLSQVLSYLEEIVN